MGHPCLILNVKKAYIYEAMLGQPTGLRYRQIITTFEYCPNLVIGP